MTDLFPNAYTVFQLNQYIRDYLAESPALRNITVRGEISNLHPFKDMLFFSLKDENATIRAVLYNASSKLPFKPENGMNVLCTGFVVVYVRDGQYQINVTDIRPDGVGSLAVAFLRLKEKLSAEGLFALDRKKPIPLYPFRIGLITAPNRAAVKDLLSVIRRRFPAADILLAPATVQGPNAPAELIRSLRLLDENGLCDVIIIARGGGSMEELWCFNDENLARAVFACRTPTISGVGHETDETIIDYVVDWRAPTPSAAAERAVPVQSEILQSLQTQQKRIRGAAERTVSFLSHRLTALTSRPVLANPQAFLSERTQHLANLEERLTAALSMSLDRKKQLLHIQQEKMSALNPLSVLDRGFALAVDEKGGILRKADALPAGTRFHVRLSDGSVRAVSEGPSD